MCDFRYLLQYTRCLTRYIKNHNRIGGVASEGRRHFASLLDDGSVDGRRALAVTLCDCTLKQWDENGREPLPGYGAFDGDLLIEWVRQMALALAAVRDLGPGDEGKKRNF